MHDSSREEANIEILSIDNIYLCIFIFMAVILKDVACGRGASVTHCSEEENSPKTFAESWEKHEAA